MVDGFMVDCGPTRVGFTMADEASASASTSLNVVGHLQNAGDQLGGLAKTGFGVLHTVGLGAFGLAIASTVVHPLIGAAPDVLTLDNAFKLALLFGGTKVALG